MGVAVMLTWKGLTIEDYDRVLADLRLDADKPAGGILHWAGPTDSGVQIVDIWESAEQFERFGEERLAPVLERQGITSEPDVTIVPIHNIFAPGVELIAEHGASSLPSAVSA